ncbi:glycosyltransferase family 39 protein [Thiomicrorhabdus sediminis]|nr:glycosyltransferase family 39 protein [Thiomicrorhabdus sediminis]
MTSLINTPQKASVALVAFMTLIHLIMAFHVELGGDEAHYALYGLMPDWSYFDHPPLIGWLQMLPMALLPFDWAARLVPITLYALLNYLLYRVTIELFGDQSAADNNAGWLGFFSLVLLNSSLILSLMGMAMLPDNPLMVIVLALLLVIKRMMDSGKRIRLSLWLWLGVLVGLAALAKYTAITIVVSLVAIMLMEKRFYWLKQPGLYLAVAISALMLLPVLYWNASHDWASFIYQINHGTHSDSWQIERLLQTQAIQLIVYSPLIFVAGWLMMLKASNYINPANHSRRLLLAFALPVTLLFGWGSGFEPSLPHWTSLAWLLLIPIVADSLWQQRQKRWVKNVIAAHLLIMVPLVLLLHSFIYQPWIAFADYKHPLQGDYGWPEAAAKAEQLQQQIQQQSDAKKPALFVSNWSYASHLAWYARPQPVFITSSMQTQFEFWYGRPQAGMDGLLVAPHYEPNPPLTNEANHFESCQRIDQLDMHGDDNIIVSYYFYHCRNYLP